MEWELVFANVLLRLKFFQCDPSKSHLLGICRFLTQPEHASFLNIARGVLTFNQFSVHVPILED